MTEDNDILELSVSSIRDYLVCSLFYDFRYNKKEHEPISGRELMAQRFENTLKKVVSFFFYKKQAGIVPSYNALLSRWEKFWFPKDMTAYDIAIDKHSISRSNLISYSNTAVAALEAFHEDFAEDQSDPLLIDESFLIPLGDGIRLNTNFDLTLRKGGVYQVVKWSGRRTVPGADFLSLDFSALRLAYEHRVGSSHVARYKLYNLASPTRGFVDVPQPSQADVEALLYWASKIKKDQVFVPRRGFTAYCKNCVFDKQCQEFTEWPNNA